MEKTVREILEQEVSCFSMANDTNIKRATIETILYRATDICKDRVLMARKILKERGKDVYKKYKENLPCWIPAGCVSNSARDNCMISYTNLIGLDIDNLEPSDLLKFKEQYFKEPYVVAVLDSVSGNGVYVLILIEDPKLIKEYVDYLQKLIKSKYNIEIDKKVRNIARKRFISWQEDLKQWIKPLDTVITAWNLIDYKREEDNKTENYISDRVKIKQTEDKAIERTTRAIWALLDSGYTIEDYARWYYVGCDFAALFDGERMFEKLCQNYGKQNYADVKNTWKHCLQTKSVIDDNFHKKWQGMAKNRLGADWWKNGTGNLF